MIKQYGRRNFSELGVERYQRIFGNAMHARGIANQKQEAMIGCGVANKMTSLGMPVSYRSARILNNGKGVGVRKQCRFACLQKSDFPLSHP